MNDWKQEDKNYLTKCLRDVNLSVLSRVLIVGAFLICLKTTDDPKTIIIAGGVAVVLLTVTLMTYVIQSLRRQRAYLRSKTGEERKSVQFGLILGLIIAVSFIVFENFLDLKLFYTFLIVIPIAFFIGALLRSKMGKGS